jgi:hypothetical protein
MIPFAAALMSTQASAALNIYCDPVDTIYLGGSPLFNEMTGISTSLEEYLAGKGLNEYCDPIDTVYIGGSPLFNELTGMTITKEAYLATKTIQRN